jgi:hypothetical protein
MDFLVVLIKPKYHHSLKKKSSQRRCTPSKSYTGSEEVLETFPV